MSLFENFPYTNLHELNLDWLIKELKEVKESAVISVNGQTGEVILYQDAEVRFPTVDVGGVWEMVRAVDGDTDAGIRFTAEGVTYIIKGSRARRIYDEDNQPPYPVTSVNEQTGDVTITFPVTSVNGQTGAITLYQDQYVVLPPLTGDQLQNWNFYRYVNNVLHGIQFDNDGRAYIMNGSGRYQIYTEHNPQPFTFVDNVNNDIMTISPDAQYGSWGLLRETDSGTVGIVFSFDSATPTPYMRYTVMEGGQPVTRSVKLLTPADIPSSSGVVSVNGLAGVVTITGDNINRDGNTAQTIADALTAIEGKSNTAYNSLAYIENTDQASHNINSGEYVLWHGGLYKATSNISIGAVLSSSNLTAVSNGGFNSLNQAISELNDKIAQIVATNAGSHNSIYRGKSLGTSYTAAQSAAVTAGTFDDMYVGDYWTINGVTWRIAGFDIYYRAGDSGSGLGHHIVVVPDAALENSKWNDSNNTVSGGPSGGAGYVGSKIRAAIKATNGSQDKVIAAFGSSHVLSWRALYPTTYDSSGNATGWAWTDARVELMNETQVYGHQVWTGNGAGNGYEDGICKQILPLFALNPQMVNIRASWWLRSVSSASYACNVYNSGTANYYGASGSVGVRPLSLIA